jgi:uncharacterized protein (DUF4415 family)
MKQESLSNWELARYNYNNDVPIPYDPEDDLYDPNDPEAVEAFFNAATVRDATGKIIRYPLTKETVALELTTNTFMRLKELGSDWQAKADAILTEWVKKQART